MPKQEMGHSSEEETPEDRIRVKTFEIKKIAGKPGVTKDEWEVWLPGAGITNRETGKLTAQAWNKETFSSEEEATKAVDFRRKACEKYDEVAEEIEVDKY